MATRILASTTLEELDLSSYNPLIADNSEDTVTKVNAVLGFLSQIMIKAADEQGTAIIDEAWGLSLVLDTCRAALQNIETEGEASHG